MSIDPLQATQMMRSLTEAERQERIKQNQNVIDARLQFLRRQVVAQKPFGGVA